MSQNSNKKWMPSNSGRIKLFYRANCEIKLPDFNTILNLDKFS